MKTSLPPNQATTNVFMQYVGSVAAIRKKFDTGVKLSDDEIKVLIEVSEVTANWCFNINPTLARVNAIREQIKGIDKELESFNKQL